MNILISNDDGYLAPGLAALVAALAALFLKMRAEFLAAAQVIVYAGAIAVLFVFAIMVIAGTRPILQTAMAGVRMVARTIPLPGSTGFYFTVMALVPLLGSFITEPAAMTLAGCQTLIVREDDDPATKAVKVLGEAVKTNPWAEKYHKIFFSISSKNFNVLREVKLPQWSDRGGHKCI